MTYKLLDISRLCMRAHHAAPTGIDRVEFAYAAWLLSEPTSSAGFVVTLPGGLWTQLPRPVAKWIVGRVQQRWRGGWSEIPMPALYGLLGAAAILAGALRALRLRRPPPGPVVYLNVSHHLLHATGALRAVQRFYRARFVALVHDLIPITHPEYVRAGHAARHRLRIAAVVELADGIITNSRATLTELAHRKPRALLRSAPLGIAAWGGSAAPAPTGDYFLCIGTLEPRKNHLLLLNLWRAMAEASRPGRPPRLIIVGRRGWENEMIVDMLERCETLKGLVEERNRVADAELEPLLHGALAVLMPSFAEGFGLPIAEALSVGVPVICSDLPAHREVGGDAPDYLDPLDAPAWRRTIECFAEPGSAARAAQIERLKRWRPPLWADHFAAAERMIDDVSRAPS